MATQYLHFATRDRSALGGKLWEHVIGQHRDDTSGEREGRTPALNLLDEPPEELLDEAVKIVNRTPRHHRAAPVVEALFDGPPRYEPKRDWTDDEYQNWEREWELWNDERVLAWARADVSWARALMPRAELFAAYLHQDEARPHVHLCFVPVAENGRISWRQLAAEATGLEPGSNVEKDKQRAIGRELQNLYYDQVGIPFGLGRGAIGAGHKNKKLTPAKRKEAQEDRKEYELVQKLIAMFELRDQFLVLARDREGVLAQARQLQMYQLGVAAGIHAAQEALQAWLKKNAAETAILFQSKRDNLTRMSRENSPTLKQAREMESTVLYPLAMPELPDADLAPASDLTHAETSTEFDELKPGD